VSTAGAALVADKGMSFWRLDPVFANLRKRKATREAAQIAYGNIVAQSRAPDFYLRWGVPDTLDGRFELLVLHVFMVLNRLKRGNGEAGDFSQLLFDIMCADLDRGIREMGATDLGVGRHVKTMARAFFGRVSAYEKGLGDRSALFSAIRRNLYGTVDPREDQLDMAVTYIFRQVEALSAASTDSLLTGEIPFAKLGDQP
jgi:cytochrome b pre-mRNA-processing protein 3